MEAASLHLAELYNSSHGSLFISTIIESSTKKERYMLSIAIYESIHTLLRNKYGARVIVTLCLRGTYSEYKCCIKKLFDINQLSKTIKSQVAISTFPELLSRMRPKYRNVYYIQISNFPQFKLFQNLLSPGVNPLKDDAFATTKYEFIKDLI